MESTIAGHVRIGALHARKALRPTLSLHAYVDLDPVGDTLYSGTKVENYRMTDLRGEISLRGGPIIGQLCWVGARADVRANDFHSESQLELACELDPWTLERLENLRGGDELVFSLELVPRLEHDAGFIPARIEPVHVSVPKEEWLRFLEAVGYGSYELIELRVPLDAGDEVRDAAEALRDAQAALHAGAPEEALSRVRFILEALEDVARRHAPDGAQEPAKPRAWLREFLEARTDEKRAGYFAGIHSRLKSLSALRHHHHGQGVRFSVAEARLSVRTAASLLEVVASLL